MSHFYASIQGNRGEATRQGTKESGMTGHVRSWTLGVRVRCFVNHDGEDECCVELTSGSGYEHLMKHIGNFTREDLETENLPSTFTNWMKDNLSEGEMKDLAKYGADTGWPGLTYYRDTVRLYESYHDDIWDMLCEDAEQAGYDSVFAFMAIFGRNDAVTDTQFKNLLVWYAAERVARRITQD